MTLNNNIPQASHLESGVPAASSIEHRYECPACKTVMSSGGIPKACVCGEKNLTLLSTSNSIIENYLKNSDFFEMLVQETALTIEGEEAARRLILLCAAGGSLVKNAQVASYNLIVNDDSGKGKDFVVSHTLDILPKNRYVKRSRISPTVLTYWHQDEAAWSWDGKVLYLEDISEGVLNSDVFKVMQSSGSHATIVIKNKAVDIAIEGKPVCITTTAQSTPNPELVRRNIILNLDSSKDQTRAVMKRQAKNKLKGCAKTYNSDLTIALALLERVGVIIPYAEEITEHFPHRHVFMRTNFPRFLDFIAASAALHQYQRERDTEGYVIAQQEDYDVARLCFQAVCGNREMIQLPLNQKKILAVFQSKSNLRGSASVLMPELKGAIKSLITMQNHLHALVEAELLASCIEKDTLNRDIEVYYLPLDSQEKVFIIPKLTNLTKLTKLTEITKVTLKEEKKKVDTLDVSHTLDVLRLNEEPFTAQEAPI